MKMLNPLLIATIPSLLGACSSQDLYAQGQNWQRQECRKIPDLAERSRCERSAAISFERYQAEADAARQRETAPK